MQLTCEVIENSSFNYRSYSIAIASKIITYICCVLHCEAINHDKFTVFITLNMVKNKQNFVFYSNQITCNDTIRQHFNISFIVKHEKIYCQIYLFIFFLPPSIVLLIQNPSRTRLCDHRLLRQQPGMFIHQVVFTYIFCAKLLTAA